MQRRISKMTRGVKRSQEAAQANEDWWAWAEERWRDRDIMAMKMMAGTTRPIMSTAHTGVRIMYIGMLAPVS